MKRIISLLAALILVLTMVPVVAFAAETVTVYMDPANGADTNNGLTQDAPVKTITAAYAALSGADAGTVVFLSTLTLTKATTFPAASIPVTLTSATGAEGISSGYTVYFSGPTTLKNMTVTCSATNAWTLLCGNGYTFVVDENVTSLATSGYRFCIQGASNTKNCASVDLTVKSGQWRNIYAGAHAAYAVTGNAKMVISGATVDTSISPSYRGTIKGDLEITVSDSTDNNTMFACPNNVDGGVEGDVTVILGDNFTGKSLFIEGAERGTVKGTTTVILDGENLNLNGITCGAKPANGGASTVILKNGILKGAVAADTVSVDVPQGKTLVLDGADLKATDVKTAGTVTFRGTATLTAASVTGTVNCAIEGEPLSGHLYVAAPAGSSVAFDTSTGIKENNGQWTVGGVYIDDTFKGLVLMAKPDVTVTLYTGYSEGSAVTPIKTETGELNLYYYDLSAGNYRYIVSGTGYYKVEQGLYMSAEKLATRTVVDVTPPVKSGEGWEQTTTVKLFTDEVYNGPRKDDISQWPEYADVFTTPYFTEERTAYQMTTQDQMEAFIQKLDDPNDNLYTFSAGRSSGYGFDLPAVVVTKTDLSGADTLEEAAALVGQDKPTIFYRAHMHGSEPASGEAALAILQRLDGALGEKVLDKINVVILPRNNPDGASTYTRTLTSTVDPNGDLLRAVFSETEAYLNIFNLFEPELVLDGHEYTNAISANYLSNSDALIGLGFAMENSEEFKEAYRPLDAKVRENLTANGLYYRYYDGNVNHNGAQTSRSNASVQGTMFVLIESQGINTGTACYSRRVVTHAIAMQTMIEYVADNAETVQAVVDAERKRIVTMGSTYEETDQVYLELATSKDSSWTHPASSLYQDGRLVEYDNTPNVWNTVVRSRTAPTAYVLPAGTTYIDDVLALMDKQGIAYTYIPAGSQVLLQQYTGTVPDSGTITDVALTPEQTVTFGSGAYVFCKNQIKGNLLSMLMEPDVTKLTATKSGLALRGMIPWKDGKFALYRYVHDLNNEGFIDYTVKEAAKPVHLTVYLDGTKGSDIADGLTEATAVKTLQQAYNRMYENLGNFAEGSDATLVVMGMYDLGATMTVLPDADFPVIITGKTAADGLKFTGGSDQQNRSFHLRGDTTFENMTLHIANTQTFNYLLADGHKLTIGEGVNTTVSKENCYFTLAGGRYDYTERSFHTDVTVRSGSWRTIYAGGYRASVDGAAKLDVSGAYVYTGIYASYCGDVVSAEITVADTTVNGAIHAGPATANSSYKIGKVKTDTVLTLGKNITATGAYASCANYGSILGTATVVLAGVDTDAVPVVARYPDLHASGTVQRAVLQLGQDVSKAITVDPGFVLDLNGHNVTGKLTAGGSLAVMDSQTADFTVADGVYGKITGTVDGTLVADKGYVCVDGTSFHRLALGINRVVVRPSVSGMYYVGVWRCDEVLAAQIDTFGVAVSTASMPTADFRNDGDTLWTKMDGSRFVSGQEMTSAIISGILKDGQDNGQRGKLPVYAAAYAICKDGTVIMADQSVEYSLYDAMALAEARAFAANSTKLNAFYNAWESVMSAWGFRKIGKAAG